jgi:hypothetical protein
MINLSANTLFHFTPKEYFLEKFEKGFTPRLLEEFDPQVDSGFFSENVTIRENGKPIEDKDMRILYVPMVCFCDIPMSSLSFHMDVYSSYGIGMKKEWGIKKGLNPVMYVNNRSHFYSNVIGSLFGFDFMSSIVASKIEPIYNDTEFLKQNELVYELIGMLGFFSEHMYSLKNTIQCYLKPFTCKGLYKGKYPNYSYYNEKEWRYSPVESVNVMPPIHSILSSAEKEEINLKLSEHRLEFSPDDISFIILPTVNEIDFFINGLRQINERTGKFPEEVINELRRKLFIREETEGNI